MSDTKTWFVTGASKGIGLALVRQLLAQGHRVAATSRKIGVLKAAVGEETERFLPLEVDLVDEASVQKAVAEAHRHFNGLQIVVNNAGYGQLGALEELTDAEARTNFDVNVFGSLNVIRHAMPYLREQGAGHIINIASIAGYTGSFPGWGIYCATKFAVVGFTESLAEEVKEFGVKATAVLPGYFRTNFLDADSLGTAGQKMDAYTAVRQSEQWHQNTVRGNQPGDPEKAAAAMIELAAAPNPPVHLFLGQDSFDMALQKMTAVKQEVESWKALATSTGF